MADMTQFEQAVDQVVEDSLRLHKVVNGTATETVTTEDGSEIPTVRKAFVDNLFFKTPAIPWVSGTQAVVFNQLYAFNGSSGVQWWYAPGATASTPVTLPANPSTSVNWRIYNDSAAMSAIYAPIDSPILTGNPQAPTPAANSNSSTIATTAFVTSAITTALAGISSGSVSFTNLIVSGTATINNLVANGTTTLNGPVNADNSIGRFRSLVLTKQDSTLTFDYTDATNPSWLKTRAEVYGVQSHTLKSDILLNGTASSDDTTMSITGVGNNLFDYVYIRGNSSKPATSPRLKVSGLTEVENLKITGTVTGLSLSVDGLDISPRSVTTTQGVTVGSDLKVNGISTLASTTAQAIDVVNDLSVDGSTTLSNYTAQSGEVQAEFTVGGLSTLNGGFTTGAGNGNIGGDLIVAGSAQLLDGLQVSGNTAATGDLTVTGDVVLNDGTGTTTVNNLVINGTVTGLTVDLTGQSISVASLSADGLVTTNSLTVTGGAQIENANVAFLTLTAQNVASSTASWSPDGKANIYNVVVDSNLTIGPWPDPSNAFSAVIYLTQDSTGGHTVTLDPNYLVLNSETVNQTAGSVTILQLTFNGVEGGVIDTMIARRP